MYRPAATPKVYARIGDDALEQEVRGMSAKHKALPGALAAPSTESRVAERLAGAVAPPEQWLSPTLKSRPQWLTNLVTRLRTFWSRRAARVGSIAGLVTLVALLGLLQWPRFSHAVAEPLKARAIEPEGEMLRLPADCLLGKLQSEATDYVRFDGQYPAQWPALVRLPFGFYNQGQGKLTVVNARPGDPRFASTWKIAFRGLVRGTPDELIMFFRNQMKDAGLQISFDGRSPGIDLRGIGKDPGKYMLSAHPQDGTKFPAFDVKVSYLADMDGWTYINGYCLYDSPGDGSYPPLSRSGRPQPSGLPLGG